MKEKGEKTNWEKSGKRTDKELAEIALNISSAEEEGLKNTLKYFDRIHDKVFRFNNILIGGYFFLAEFNNSTSYYMLLIPIANLIQIIYIDYRMMENSRFQSKGKPGQKSNIDNYVHAIDKTKQYSFLILSTTALVTMILLYQIYLMEKSNDPVNTDEIEVSEKFAKPESEIKWNLKTQGITTSVNYR